MTITADVPDCHAGSEEAPRRQARNSAAFWAATGRSRRHEVIRRRGLLAVVGDERAGLRILIQEPELDREELAEIAALTGRAAGPVIVEDPFGASELRVLGMRHWRMPIMARPPGPVAEPAMEVVRVRGQAELRAAERVVIEAFELTGFEPHRGGELFPEALLEQPGVDVFVARLDGAVLGACVAIVDQGVGGHYWVGAPPSSRSRGVGRAVMLGSLAHMAGLPLTLTSSRLGRPLYESLGYAVASWSTWWASE